MILAALRAFDGRGHNVVLALVRILDTSSYFNSVLGFPYNLQQPLCCAFFASFRVCRLPLRLGDDPRSTSFGVWLSDFWAAFATQSRSRFRHHLLRDVEASSVFLVSGIRRRSTLHFKVHRWKISGSCHRDFDTSILHTSRRVPRDAQRRVCPSCMSYKLLQD